MGDQRITGKLIARSFIAYALSLLIVSSVLFISAGSFGYWNAWVCLIALFGTDLIIVLYLIFSDPELLNKRLNRNEKEKSQKLFNRLYYVFMVLILVLSGLNYRFGWSIVSLWFVYCAAIIMIFGFILSLIVMRQNKYASRVIEIQEDQKVIDTGLYSIIRHPMYTAALLIFCSLPLVLGSWHLFIAALIVTPLLLVFRIRSEEKKLMNELPGYTEYLKKVKFRLIPFIW